MNGEIPCCVGRVLVMTDKRKENKLKRIKGEDQKTAEISGATF